MGERETERESVGEILSESEGEKERESVCVCRGKNVKE